MCKDNNYLKTELYSLIKRDDRIFDFLQSGATDGLWYWDLTNPENEWMNDRFWSELGYDPAEKKHLASEWQDIINQDDLALAIENFNKHCADPTHPYDQEVRYQHKNGSTVWIRCRGLVIRDEAGTPVRMIGAHSNITALKESEAKYQKNAVELDLAYLSIKAALKESEKLFDMAPDANLKLAGNGDIMKANEQATRLFGYAKYELEKLNFFSLLPASYAKKCQDHFNACFSSWPEEHSEFRTEVITITDRNEQDIVVESRLNLIATPYGNKVLATLRNISEREQLLQSLNLQLEKNKKLQELTLLDPLTQIFNKRQFDKMIKEGFKSATRHQQRLSLLLFDIDHFKQVNDQYGHDAGDKILVQLTELVSRFTRESDTFARIGGEEFAIILPFTDLPSAEVLAQRIITGVQQFCFEIQETLCIKITVSAGVSELSTDDDNWKPLFERADKGLYQAKDAGRNCVRVKS